MIFAAPKVVLSPLGLHKVVRLGANNRVGGLDVVERAIKRPLVLGDDLEGGGVVAVPLNGRGQLYALSPERKLVGAHRAVVHGGVDEGLWCRNVLNEETKGHGRPVEHENAREDGLLAQANGNGNAHGHRRGTCRILEPSPVWEGVVELTASRVRTHVSLGCCV